MSKIIILIPTTDNLNKNIYQIKEFSTKDKAMEFLLTVPEKMTKCKIYGGYDIKIGLIKKG